MFCNFYGCTFNFQYLKTDWVQACLLCSIDEIFPLVSLNFAGGASMVLKPREYLIHLSIGVSCSICIFYFNFLKFVEVDMIPFLLITTKKCWTISCVICNHGITGQCCCNVVHWISESSRTRANNFRRLDPGLKPLWWVYADAWLGLWQYALSVQPPVF